MVSMLVSLLWLVGLLVASPFRHLSDTVVAVACSLALTAIFALSIAFQNDWLLQQARSVLPSAVIAQFDLNTAALSAATLGAVLVAISLVGLAYGMQVGQHVQEQRRTARWSCATLDPPFCQWPLTSGEFYSVFLSHYKQQAGAVGTAH